MKNDAGKYLSLYTDGTRYGGVVAGERGLLAVFLPTGESPGEMLAAIAREFPRAAGESPPTRETAALLESYFAGEEVTFDLPIDGSGFTPFQRKVYAAVARISYGELRTYRDIAREMGSPGSARGVGSAMARNPLPIIIPCHRVIGTSGALTGYSAPGGVETKKRLLLLEGAMPD